MADKKSFIVYDNWSKLLASLPDEQAGKLIKALCGHQIGEHIQIDDPLLASVYQMFADKMDEDAEKYSEKVAGLKKSAAKRWNKEKASAKNANAMQMDANAPVTVTDTVTVTVTDTDTVNVTEKDIKTKSNKRHIPDSDESVVCADASPAKADFAKKRGRSVKPLAKSAQADQVKHKHGEYGKVTLTDSELAKLQTEYGADKTAAAIRYLDEYVVRKGYKHQSSYLTIKKWVIDAVEEEERKKARPRSAAPPNVAYGDFNQRTYDYDELEAKLLQS